jgi:hypothetical protein
MRASTLLVLSIGLSGLLACGGDDAPPTDGGGGSDGGGRVASGGRDGGGVDGGAVDGGGVDGGGVDGGGIADGGGEDGGGAIDGGGPVGCGDLGKPCEGPSDCSPGYECDDFRGRCLPTGRPICGGFAGADCPAGGIYSECRYLMSADFGPCLTTDEATCACAELRDIFVCP